MGRFWSYVLGPVCCFVSVYNPRKAGKFWRFPENRHRRAGIVSCQFKFGFLLELVIKWYMRSSSDVL